MKSITRTLCLIAPLTAAILAAPSANADPFTWTGGGSDLNWITSGNWNPAGPPGTNDDAIFLDQGATNDAVSINNIVSADTTVQSVWIAPTNGSTTNTEAFNTLIDPGVTLTVTGTNALSLSDYEGVGSTINPVTYLVGTLDYVALETTVTNTISGSSTLVLNDPDSQLSVRQGYGSGGNHVATLDLSGLDTFSADLSSIQVGVGDNTHYRRVVGNLFLAKTNLITVRGDDGTPGLFVGDNGYNNNGNSSHSDLILGQNNAINTDWIRVGGQKEQGMMYFDTNLFSNSSLVLRGSGGGTNRVSVIAIGDEHHQGSSGNPSTGTVDLSGGTVDILADTIYVGESQHGDNGREATGYLTLGPGTVNVNDLELGYEDTPNGNRTGAPYTASGKLDVNGTTVTVNDLLRLGREDGAPLPQVGVLNINGGSVTVNGSFATEGDSSINVTNGLLDLPPHSSILGDIVTVDGGTISNVDVLQATNTLTLLNGGVIASPLTFDMGDSGMAIWDLSQTASGGLTVSNTFSGAGTIYGNLTMAPGSTLVPGEAGNVQPLYANNNMTLNGATLREDLSSGGNYFNPDINDEISVTGNLTLEGTNRVRVTALNGALDTSTPYSLIYYGGTLAGSADNLQIAGPMVKSRYTFTFDTTTANYVNLVVGGAGSANLVWTGNAPANDWDLTNTPDWSNAGNPDKFYNLDSVTFDDTGVASSAVNLAATLYPGSITMSNAAKAYVFSGPGAFGGTSLTNYGAGGLTISNDATNNFDKVDVENGNVTFGGGSANLFGAGGLLVNATLGTASVTIANTNANDFGPAGIVLNNSALIFDQAADAEVDSPISGPGTVTKHNSNTLTLGGDDSGLSGPIVVTAGTLKVGTATAVENSGGVFVTNSGALDVNGQDLSSSSITVTASGAGPGGTGAIVNSGSDQTHAFDSLTLAGDTTLGGSGRWDVRGSGSSSAILSLNGGGYNITKTGSNEVALVYCSVDPTLGNIDVQQGEFAIQEPQTAQGGVGDPTKTITVHSNAMLETYGLGPDYPLDKRITLQDGAIIQNDHDISILSGQITLEGNTWVNDNNVFVFTNGVGGAGGLTLLGGSTLILPATNTYSGATVVSNGTLQVDGVIGGSGVDVAGGTLAGIGSVTAPVSVETNGTVSPGDGSLGTLSVAGSLDLAGVNRMDLDKTSGVLTSDLITNVTTLTLGGTLELNVTGDTALADGDSFTLYSASSIKGSFSSVNPATPGAGLQWDTSQLSSGVLKVAVAAPAGPAIGSVAVSGGNVSFNITGGNADATFYILTSTNVATPLSSWKPVATNQFDAGGGFSFTNAVSGGPQQFFIIQLAP